MRHFARSVTVLAALTGLVGCGGSSPAKSAEATTGAAPMTTSATSDKLTLKRSRVRAAIGQGLGAFLQNVSVEDWPAMKDGKFYGFKLRSIRNEWGVDLKPGDVILRVNGMPIEHPEEADAAMRALDKAPSLRVDYEREGKPRVLEIPIVEDAPAR